MPKNIYDFVEMEMGDERIYKRACPVKGKKSRVHSAFIKYADRHGWDYETHIDREKDELLLVRLK